jgi:hypothetical protein
LAVAPRPLLHCSSQVLDRGAQAATRSAAQVLDRGAQAVARGAARRASQVLDRGAKAVASAFVRCASQVHHRGAQAAARGAAQVFLSWQDLENITHDIAGKNLIHSQWLTTLYSAL